MENKKSNERVLAHYLATIISDGDLNQITGGTAAYGSRTRSHDSTQGGKDHVDDDHSD